MDGDDDFDGAFFSPAWCSLLMDELFAAALAGDEKAGKVVRRMLPQDVPAHEAISWRNDEIRVLANWLIEILAEAPSNHLLAAIVATAGTKLSAGRKLHPNGLFDRLTADELAELSARVRRILERCPRWPRLRRTLEILAA